MSDQSIMAVRRLFARAIDQLSFIALVDVLVPFDAFSPLIALALMFAFVPIEAMQVWIFGTSLGKLVLGLKVITPGARETTFTTALYRSALAWVVGQGVGIGLILPVTYVLSYSRLTEGKPTFWDEQLGTDVVDRARTIGQA